MNLSRQYLAAIAVAAIYKFSWWRPWVIVKPAWAVLMSFLPWPKVSEEVYEMRMADCFKCPYFYHPLATCNSPLAVNANHHFCYCHMPTKAKLRYATCSARKLYPRIGIGWRKELTFEYDRVAK